MATQVFSKYIKFFFNHKSSFVGEKKFSKKKFACKKIYFLKIGKDFTQFFSKHAKMS